jgi:uncharacterized protein
MPTLEKNSVLKDYRKDPWVNSKVKIRDSTLHGKGMFAKEPIFKGEIVAIWGGNYISKEEMEAIKRINNPDLKIQQIEEDVFEVWTKETTGNDPTYFHNHSCDPNTWMEDEVTISAMRGINAGEELTIDYAVFEMKEGYVITDNCACGSNSCRKKITGSDWRLPRLQERYKGHFSPLIKRRIANLNRNKDPSNGRYLCHNLDLSLT